jgi:hypothetical protein
MDFELESQRGQLLTKDDLRCEFGKLKLVLLSDLAEFRAETNERFSEMRDGVRRIELQLQTLHADTCWFILRSSVVVVGAVGVMLGLLFLFTHHFGK